MSRYSIYPCTFNDGSDNDITQMESFSVNTGSNKSSIIPGGALDRAHIGLGSARPMANFTTRDLTGFFGFASGTVGLACSGGATFRLQQRSDGSTFATGTSHETYSSAKGFLRPVSLSASQDDDNGAMLNCEYYALWDGSTDPFVHNSSVNYSTAPTPAFSSRFFLGPVYHNSSQLSSIVSWSIDFGINYQPKAFNGEPFPKIGSIITRTPSVTFSTTDANVATGLDMFIAGVTSSLDLYLQKGASNSDRVAAATTQHLKIGISAGEWSINEASVSGNDDGTISFTAQPTGAITLSVASAIP